MQAKEPDRHPTDPAIPRGRLKERVTRGVAWSMAEKVGSTLLQIAVSLTILRLLSREELGIMALLTAASAIAIVLSDSGFSQTLIRKKHPVQGEYKAVFGFNLFVSLLLYAFFVLTAPFAADFYQIAALKELAPVFFLILPINALSTVQNTLLVREFRFATISKITFFAALISGIAAIGLALMGMGVWAIVMQRLIHMSLRSLLLWMVGGWKPSGKSNLRALRQMAPYSCSLMATDLITTFYNKIPQFFLGRLYSADTLGSFDQAIKLKDQPLTSVMQSVQSVTFPALSNIRDEAARFAESYRQVVMVVCYVLFPVMIGLSAVAHDLFEVVLGEKWMPTVPYFEVVCLAGLFYPIGVVAYNVMKVKSDGKIIYRSEILKKVLMTVIFALTIPWSVQAVIWGLVLISFTEMAVNIICSSRFTTLKFGALWRTIRPIAAATLLMYAAVRGIALLPIEQTFLHLLLQICGGAFCYLLTSVLFRMEAFAQLKEILSRKKK